MPDSDTLTIRLSNDVKGKLATSADRTHRTRSFLVAEAISVYVERELAIVEGIKRGRANVRAGRVASNDEVTREARVIIEVARAKA